MQNDARYFPHVVKKYIKKVKNKNVRVPPKGQEQKHQTSLSGPKPKASAFEPVKPFQPYAQSRLALCKTSRVTQHV